MFSYSYCCRAIMCFGRSLLVYGFIVVPIAGTLWADVCDHPATRARLFPGYCEAIERARLSEIIDVVDGGTVILKALRADGTWTANEVTLEIWARTEKRNCDPSVNRSERALEVARRLLADGYDVTYVAWEAGISPGREIPMGAAVRPAGYAEELPIIMERLGLYCPVE